MATTKLDLIDGTQTVRADLGAVRLYELAARIEGAVTRSTEAEVGPALNQLYAQALEAVFVDPSLGGLACGLREGTAEGPALELELTVDRFTEASGVFGLTLGVTYEQPAAASPRREALLQALTAALATNVPSADTAAREQVIAAVAATLAAQLGVPVRRNAARPVDCRGSGPVVILRDGDQQADYTVRTDQVFYDADLAVELFLPGHDEAGLDAGIQGVLAAIHGMDSLGGLALDVLEGDADPEVLRQLYTGPLLAGRVELEVYYRTPFGKPYQVGTG